jgi:uncharacterized membrane protein
MKSHTANSDDFTLQTCEVCKKQFKPQFLYPLELVRPNILKLIKENNTGLSTSGFICTNDLNHYRGQYIDNILKHEQKDIKDLEKKVSKSIHDKDFLTKNTYSDYQSSTRFGDRLADKIAAFGGSWKFIIIFMAVLLIWILINTWLLLSKPFDPYPFILLNLILSCIAAVQAPVIMMSQNRQEAKDRLQSENDYVVNLKSELEIRLLHEKIDHLLMKHWNSLMEIQQFQTEIMEEILSHKEK